MNIVIAGILALALWTIHLAVQAFAEDESTLGALVPSIVLTVWNLLTPWLFFVIGKFEEWRTPVFLSQMTVARAVVLRMVGLYVFFYTVLINREKFMVG